MGVVARHSQEWVLLAEASAEGELEALERELSAHLSAHPNLMRLMHAMAVVLFRRGATELAEQWVARALASGAPQDKRELHELKLFEARLQKPAHPTGRNSTVRELAPSSPRARAGLPTPKRPVEGEFDWEPMESGQAGDSLQLRISFAAHHQGSISEQCRRRLSALSIVFAFGSSQSTNEFDCENNGADRLGWSHR